MFMRHNPAEAECIYDRSAIDELIASQAIQINLRYKNERPLVLCVMTGALIYAGQLLPHLDFALDLDYVHATRYGLARQGGGLNWLARPRTPVAGRSVLLLDDILDEGVTLQEIAQWLIAEGAASVSIAVLCRKHKAQPQPCQVDYPALELPDRYVYGFGLDVSGLWRNANGIFVASDAS